MWQLDADHPDKNGLQLRKLAFVLKAFVRAAREYGGAKVGVMWEVCSVPKLKLEGRDEVLAMRQSDGGAGRTAAGGKCRLPCRLSEDGAPSASLDHLEAQAAPTHPRAPPQQLGG